MRDVHPEFQTVVAVVGGVSVMGVLPGSAWRPEGLIAVSGDVSYLWRDQARELADALRLVADRMDACAQQRYGPSPTTGAAMARITPGAE